MVTIQNVADGSPAYKHGIRPGDILISINGKEINDVLDYRFYLAEKTALLKIHRGAELFDVTIRRSDIYSDIGLEFESFLIDKKRSCKNGCVFCFIDQLPKGMRDTLYFKDDDSRLSFLMGNYITLTNLTDQDIDRIIDMHMSPINISVHTTNPELRVKMMKNKRAGDSLKYISRLANSGITVNAQIVLCRGLNDGDELIRTMQDLSDLHPSVASVSVVPCGLTDYRDNLYPLTPFSAEECGNIIDTVSKFSDECLKKYGSRIFFCGDEMYVKSARELPAGEYYEGFPQIENGIGMISSMRDEFDSELDFIKENTGNDSVFDYDGTECDLSFPRSCSIATGFAAFKFISSLIEKLTNICYNLKCTVYPIKNDFFGENITVSGLITASDLKKQLYGKPLGDTLFLPASMLRSEGDLFLDSISKEELSEYLGVNVRFISNDGADFIRSLLL